MRAGVAWLLAVLLAGGCSGHAHRFAGTARANALVYSRAVASAMPNVEALTNDFAQPMTAKPLGTFRSRNSSGGESWLTVFRLFKHQVNDLDQACVWAWARA